MFLIYLVHGYQEFLGPPVGDRLVAVTIFGFVLLRFSWFWYAPPEKIELSSESKPLGENNEGQKEEENKKEERKIIMIDLKKCRTLKTKHGDYINITTAEGGLFHPHFFTLYIGNEQMRIFVNVNSDLKSFTGISFHFFLKKGFYIHRSVI